MPEMDNPRLRYRVVEAEESHDGIPLTPSNMNSQSHHPKRPARWSIGWVAPTLIIGLFMSEHFEIAIILAVGHYSYFRYLHLKFVHETIPQDWNNAIAISFTRLFSWAVVGSVAVAYTQLLWWYLRRKPLRMTTVDALFAIISSPVNLLNINVVKSATVLWFFALLAPLVPIVTTLPPGALIVHNLPHRAEREQKMSTIDVDFRGNKSAVELFKYMMFSVGADGEYRIPQSSLIGVASQTVLQGAWLPRSSPCGPNCTYSLVFSAPTLKCDEPGGRLDLEQLVFQRYTNESTGENAMAKWNPDPLSANYLSLFYRSDNTILRKLNYELFVMDVRFQDQESSSWKNISCVTLEATYNATVRYTENTQVINLTVTPGPPLNATEIGRSYLFYGARDTDDQYGILKPSDDPQSRLEDEELNSVYRRSQIRAIQESLAFSLAGAISQFGQENWFTVNTIVATTLSLLHMLEELMHNVTLSLFNRATNFTSANIITEPYEQAYIFQYRARLIGPYAAILVTALCAIVYGLLALIRNGVAATSGVFLQIMCTTTNGNSHLNQIAAGACLRGNESLSQELKDVKILFGEVRDGESQGGMRKRAAFGTVNETVPLMKGVEYGC